MDSIVQTTVKHGLCIGCGVCAAICPTGALCVKSNSLQENLPEIDKKACTNCGLCASVCANSVEKRKTRLGSLKAAEDPEACGLQEARYALAWDTDNAKRKKSSSGGVVTALLSHMLSSGEAAGVVHGRALYNECGKPHFEAVLSTSVAELDATRSSFYAPLNFQSVLEELAEKPAGTFVCVGTPCVIATMKAAFAKSAKLKKHTMVSIALICSHNVNGQFSDFLAASMGVPDKAEYRINMRAKDDEMQDSNFFRILAETKDGRQFKQDRFESHFTRYWRAYAFAMKSCIQCMDFWGDEADLSVKDAWGKWSSDNKLGKSILVIRTAGMEALLENLPGLHKEPLSFRDVRYSQKATTDFKLKQAVVKHEKPLWAKENRDNQTFFYSFNAWYAKRVYKACGLKVLDASYLLGGRIRAGLSALQKFLVVRSAKRKNILILGGYGRGNTGDEAQLAAALQNVRTRFPDYTPTVLTPNPEYTYFHHQCMVSLAPRVAFYDTDINDLYMLRTRFSRVRFLMRSAWIYCNALLDKIGLPVLLSPKRARMLHELRTSAIVYYSGGGYLTAPTLSRLWDACVFILLAKLYRVPVVLSGQTMGIFQTRFNKWFARKAFSYASAITVRDPDASPRDLEEIGVKAEVMFDDALFCDKETSTQLVDAYLKNAGIDPEKKYTCLHLHYWGADTEEARGKILEKISTLCFSLCKKEKRQILLIPMVDSDMGALLNFYGIFGKNFPLHVFRYNFDYRIIRAVIARSEMCITMKHHPIIFAMGEAVPVISLNYMPYYHHKNTGALAIFGQERFSVPLDEDAYLYAFNKSLKDIEENGEAIRNELQELLPQLKVRQDKFYEAMRAALQDAGGPR